MEVLGWKGEDISPLKDGAIERCQIKAGDGFTSPNDGALVEGISISILFIFFNFVISLVKLLGTYNGRTFDDREISFNLGEGCDLDVCEGVEKALKKFKRGEHSRIIIQPKYAFGSQGKLEWNIPSNAVIEYEINLKSFEKANESWSLDSKERIEQGKLFKEKGTKYFKAEKFELAIKMYKKVLSFLEHEKGK